MIRVRVAIVGVALAVGSMAAAQSSAPRTFASPEDAVRALVDALKARDLERVIAIFGPDGRELAESSDPANGRRNREVFLAAFRERWHLVSTASNRRTLVIGNEEWPFPVPLLKSGGAWHFDTAAGKEEVLDRRIGRNELAAIATARTYVAAQKRYARDGHDGNPAGVYAATFASAPGRQNGLYWPAKRGEPRSPLGDLVAQAAEDGQTLGAAGGPSPSPFHGYYFRIVTAQGAHARGGTKSYLVDGRLTGGFALVAWPAQYDVSGVMTFIVNQDGVVRQKDLGPNTAAAAAAISAYDPDPTWATVR